MNGYSSFASRRHFLRSVSISAAALAGGGLFARGALAEELTRTPEQTEGPFYPDKLPLDTDNDLIFLNDNLTPAVGEITHLSGRILDGSGAPVRNAVVEIWQTDAGGAYVHTRSGNGEKRDGNFQGFGRFLTGSTGEYYFRTIKPVTYPGRTPHIHYKVKLKGQDDFATQCYIKGHPQNARDGVLRRVRDEKQRAAVQVDFAPMENSLAGELTARFDVVMGWTPTG